jgi:hypothetical protein
MKAFVIGVKRVAGTSKKTGNDFDMSRVLVGTPIQPVRNDRMTVEGFGYEVNEIPCTDEALGQFRGVKLPGVVDLVSDTRAFRGKLEVIISGVNAVEKAAA